MLKLLSFGFMFLFSAQVFGDSAESGPAVTPPHWQDFYIQEYKLPDVYTKLVDNSGNGFDALYGTRNFREVLPGILYRGGANNSFNKHGKRPNQNPLPTEGLVNLCDQGFSNAVYLYPDNFETAPHSESCQSIRGGNGHLDYVQNDPMNATGLHATLELVSKAINGQTAGPIYVHCWNGWHASGFVSATSLRQFCGFTADQAVDYWNKNTDGNNVGPEYDAIRNDIRNFVPFTDLNISVPVQQKVCPAATDFQIDMVPGAISP